MTPRIVRLALVLSLLAVHGLLGVASAQPLPTISSPRSGQPSRRFAPPVTGKPFTNAATPGQQCTTLTFEGLADQVAVPSISGINSPGWLSLIDEDAGGTGNFANEPSPETIMFWLGSNPSIVLDYPASKIEFYYSTSVTLTVTAFDANNVQVTQITRAPNYLGGPGDPKGTYSGWSPLTVEVPGKTIKRLTVVGGPNFTGFDNLTVCSALAVDSVEVTQAIQQLQPIATLKAKLQTDREPPVPLVGDKPAALRVYTQQVSRATVVTVGVSGSVTGSKVMSLQPQCTVDMQRLNQNGCRSADFYFTPSVGNFDVTVTIRDSTGAVVDTHDLPLTARKTNALKLKAVSICDDQDVNGNWLCGQASVLASNAYVLKKIAPTSSVTVETTSMQVKDMVSAYASVDQWWPGVMKKVGNLYGAFDWASGLLGTTVKYFGMIRPALTGTTGGMFPIGTGGGGSRSSVNRLGVDTTAETVAHETGHGLGLRHTNTDVPVAGATPPGCYNLAPASTTDWPFADNRIQSTTRLEVGFDVAARRALDPQSTYDIMSYCVPRWISPLRYKTLITSLSGGAVTSPSTPVPAAAVGPAWLVSGTITNGAAQIDPLFVVDANLDPSTGTHAVNAVDGNGTVLATSRFTPESADAEAAGPVTAGPPAFTAMLPKVAGATALVVLSDTNTVLATVPLGGTAPAVQLVTPAASSVLSGPAAVTWVVTDPDSATHHTRVQYSADDGATWSDLGVTTSNAMQVNFAQLPGGSVARLRLIVSDGVNSTTAVFGPFSSPRKSTVEAAILSSFGGTVAPGTLYLEGVGTDIDDGSLTGASLSWSSSRDGNLGTGDRVAANLSPGAHVITMVARDSDGNTKASTMNVTVAGAPPAIDVVATAIDTLPTTCVVATLNVTTPGLPASSVEYSLNGGASWTAVATNRLPYSFIVPGSGFINLLARVSDAAGQTGADGEQFFTSRACAQTAVVTPTTLQAPAAKSSQNVVLATSSASLAWTATTDRPWLTVSPASGTGSGVVTITAAKTTSRTARTGTVTIAGRVVSVTQDGGPQGPYDFRVTDVTGNNVTLQWAYDGTTAGFVLTGGVAPGDTLAVVPLGTALPRITLAAPSGIFYLRMHTAEDTALAEPSNEIRVVVNVPDPPSPPTALLGLANGGQLDLVWTNTFDGGAPTGATLIVSGSLSGSAPVGPGNRFSFNGVPPGTYTFTVVSTNAAGASAPSAPVTLTFPGTCTAPPATPRRFLAYRTGNVVSAVWEHDQTGSAPTSYELTVAEFGVTVPVGAVQAVGAAVGPGNYTLSVAARNACGTSAPTSPQTVVVP